MKLSLKTVAGFLTAAILVLISTSCQTNKVAVKDIPEDFVFIPAGTFIMGSNATQLNQFTQPHKVTIKKPFYMCDHEVTQGEYEAVMGTNPSYFTSDKVAWTLDGFETTIPGKGVSTEAARNEVQENRPVEMVSMFMAFVYCNKRSINEGLTPCYTINEKTNPDKWGEIPTSFDAPNLFDWCEVRCNFEANGYRLPTEAEWEYAARAGDTSVDTLIFSGAESLSSLGDFEWWKNYTYQTKSHTGYFLTLGDYAWFGRNAMWVTQEVKTKLKNSFGLYDMTGNVQEWVWVCAPANGFYYSETAEIIPTSQYWSGIGVYRGGSYGTDGMYSSLVDRGNFNQPYHYSDIGFRVVRSAN